MPSFQLPGLTTLPPSLTLVSPHPVFQQMLLALPSKYTYNPDISYPPPLLQFIILSVMPDVRIPEQEESRPPIQCNLQKGKFIADSSQGSCRIQCSGAGSESPAPQPLYKFIGWAHAIGSWFKWIGYKFAKQLHWSKLSRPRDFPRGFRPVPNFLIGKQQSVLSESWLVVSRWPDNLTTQK